MRLCDELNKVLAGSKLAYRATWVPATDPEIEDDGIEVGLPDQPSALEVQLGGRYAIINRCLYKNGNLHGMEHVQELKRGDWTGIIAATLAALAKLQAATAASATPALVRGMADTRSEADARASRPAPTCLKGLGQ